MPCLHALLVAINDYPPNVPRLGGCINDLERFLAYIQEFCHRAGMDIRVLQLRNQEATRENIINGFDHFLKAEDGDSCVFFFSGHGSQQTAPWELTLNESDNKLEAQVCYDSRQPGGKDLRDKELSYLIWKVTNGKDVHFLSITDCCHSGHSMRSHEFRTRMVEGVETPSPIEDFLGWKEYNRQGDRYLPPQGRYVHLAACSDKELAKEVVMNGEFRGIFTTALLETLEEDASFHVYHQLLARVQQMIKNKFYGPNAQTPLIDVTTPEDQNKCFLSGHETKNQSLYLLAYDRELGWIVNAGEMHGLKKDAPPVFYLLREGFVVQATKVHPHCCEVDEMGDVDKKRAFPVVIHPSTLPKTSLSVEEITDHRLKEFFEREKAEWLELGDNGRFKVEIRDQTLFLRGPGGEPYLWQPWFGFEPKVVEQFWSDANQAARWLQILENRNPNTEIADEDVEIELFESIEPGNFDNDAKVQQVDCRSPLVLKYKDGNPPSFQLRVKNTGKLKRRPLFITLLYLEENFRIHNKLLQMTKLEPGQEAWAIDTDANGDQWKTIPVYIPDALIEQEVTTITEYLKLIVCTNQFNTQPYLQNGVSRETTRGKGVLTKEIAPVIRLPKMDWRSWEIELRIKK